jgi:hypothetical protein
MPGVPFVARGQRGGLRQQRAHSSSRAAPGISCPGLARLLDERFSQGCVSQDTFELGRCVVHDWPRTGITTRKLMSICPLPPHSNIFASAGSRAELDHSSTLMHVCKLTGQGRSSQAMPHLWGVKSLVIPGLGDCLATHSPCKVCALHESQRIAQRSAAQHSTG